jgi:acetyl-CoA synthetase
MTSSASAFRPVRDLPLQHRDDYNRAFAEFSWPELDSFNWALDW